MATAKLSAAVALLRAAGVREEDRSSGGVNYCGIWPDLILHEYIISSWIRLCMDRTVPTELRRLALQFSSNTAQAGRLMRYLDERTLVPMMDIAFQYRWHSALDTMARWAVLKTIDKTYRSGHIVADFCQAFSNLSTRSFSSMISRDSFVLNEEAIFEIAMAWLKQSISDGVENGQIEGYVNISDHIGPVLKNVRWVRMSLKFLMDDVYESGILTDEELIDITRAKVTQDWSVVSKYGWNCEERTDKSEFISWTSLVGKDLEMTEELGKYLDWLDQLSLGSLVAFNHEGYWQNGKITRYNRETDTFRIQKDPTHGDNGADMNRFCREIRPRDNSSEVPVIPERYLPT